MPAAWYPARSSWHDGTSESDFYWFEGRQGELVNIEVLSQALTRLGPDFIDSVVRLWTSDGQLVPYYDSVAENDDEFETTDSNLIDVRLPADGRYYIEVDTFRREPSSQSCDASLWDGLSEEVDRSGCVTPAMTRIRDAMNWSCTRLRRPTRPMHRHVARRRRERSAGGRTGRLLRT